MRAELPLWINLVLPVLDLAASVGEWASFRKQQLIDHHCSCIQCERDGRGAYAKPYSCHKKTCSCELCGLPTIEGEHDKT